MRVQSCSCKANPHFSIAAVVSLTPALIICAQFLKGLKGYCSRVVGSLEGRSSSLCHKAPLCGFFIGSLVIDRALGKSRENRQEVSVLVTLIVKPSQNTNPPQKMLRCCNGPFSKVLFEI